MKHFYLLFAALTVSALTMAQQPVITAIVDGDCSGGNPKVVEIYANGTVDFALYSFENQSNANTTWAGTTSLAPLGVRTNEFVYLTTSVSAASLLTEFPSITATNQLVTNAANNNGDDKVRIIDAAMNTIDQYGVTDVRGTGQAWEYSDSFAKRINGTGPDAVFNVANWTYGGVGFLDGLGECQMSGTATFETLIGGIATYTTTASTTPTLTILTPANGSTLDSGTFNVTLSVSNFNVAMTGGDGFITYQLDNNAAVNKFDTNPISFTNLAAGPHTIVVNLLNNAGAALSPAVSQTLNVTVSANIQAQDIAALRAVTLPSSDIYTLSNAVLVTQVQSFRNQRWIEDTSAAIVIDDPSGVATSPINIGDQVTGISGRLSDFNGLRQFTPIADFSASSTGNTVTPQVVTIAMLTANPENYESEFVEIQNATFTNANGTLVFANNTEEPIMAAGGTFNVRPVFGADYVGSVVPTASTSVAGNILQRNNTEYTIAPRSTADIATLSTDSTNKVSFSIYPNPTRDGRFNVTSSNGEQVDVVIYSVLGQQVASVKNVTETIVANHLTAGIYLVRISQGTRIESRKLIVE